MSEILFIRHAETDSLGTFCGHSDPAVNEAGVLQIDGLISRLRGGRLGGPVEAVYASDLARARMTGEAVAEALDLECGIRPGLREMFFGAWEGMAWDEIWAADKGYAERWIAEFPTLAAPDGEGYPEFRARVLQEVEALTKLAAGGRIAVVTHAGVLGVILTDLLGLSPAAAWKRTREYCCVVAYRDERRETR